jgi:hypothetical protein
VWDFTDSSFHPSIELKAAHAKITSLELLASVNSRLQLIAVGDEVGTLHIFEMPRNLVKPVHREEAIMLKFLERELVVRMLRFIVILALSNYFTHRASTYSKRMKKQQLLHSPIKKIATIIIRQRNKIHHPLRLVDVQELLELLWIPP